MRSPPVNAMIAIALALLPVPALKLLDHVNRGCGDGLCGFSSGVLLIGGILVAVTVFLVRSARRAEVPSLLRLVPGVLLMLALVPLLF